MCRGGTEGNKAVSRGREDAAPARSAQEPRGDAAAWTININIHGGPKEHRPGARWSGSCRWRRKTRTRGRKRRFRLRSFFPHFLPPSAWGKLKNRRRSVTYHSRSSHDPCNAGALCALFFRTAVLACFYFFLCGNEFALACLYEKVLHPEEWEHVEYYAGFLDSTVLPTDHRKFCFELYSRLVQDGLCILSAPPDYFSGHVGSGGAATDSSAATVSSSSDQHVARAQELADHEGGGIKPAPGISTSSTAADFPKFSKSWYQFLIATILVNSLPLVEKQLGATETLNAYRILVALAEGNLNVLQWVQPLVPLVYGERLREDGTEEGQSGEQLQSWGKMKNRNKTTANSCAGATNQGSRSTTTSEDGNRISKMKKTVYVYDNPTVQKYTNLRLSTSFGQEGIEVLLHRWLEQSFCRTTDPDLADFFFVPFYHNGYQREAFDPPLQDSTEVMREAYRELFPTLQYFDSFRKKDHIFLFAHEFWGARELVAHPELRVDKAILLVVESNPLDMIDTNATQHCLDCFDERKDVVLPQHIDFFAMRKFRLYRKPYAEREFLFCFRGALQHSLYEETVTKPPFDFETSNVLPASKIRAQIQQWALEQDKFGENSFSYKTSLGGHLTPVVKYYETMGNCKFCLVPKGVGYTNGRVFESFFSGCIPVVLSDALRFPFADFLPWKEFAVHFPSRHVRLVPEFLQQLDVKGSSSGGGQEQVFEGEARGQAAKSSWPKSLQELWDTLVSFGPVRGMHEKLEKFSCWIDYYSEDPNCSPYEGMLRQLRRNRVTLFQD
ncbi:unnamed protein product [Amoebophrya sp. A120]|nr:unnamed protein product [Amoebophrya sp. A120]|eukprot:GSA120T00000401001.1